MSSQIYFVFFIMLLVVVKRAISVNVGNNYDDNNYDIGQANTGGNDNALDLTGSDLRDSGNYDTKNSDPITNMDVGNDDEYEYEYEEDEDTPRNNDVGRKASISTRHFPKCTCLQKIRTSFVTGNPCGQAAICYWELHNYQKQKSRINGLDSEWEIIDKTRCTAYMYQKYACLIGYPTPRPYNSQCLPALEMCEMELSKLLYDDCEPLRQKRGLPRPENVAIRTRTEDMISNLDYDAKKKFQSLPNHTHPLFNNFYPLSCPMIYRFPYFTIDLLLKDMEPNITYDETLGIIDVTSHLPKFVRIGVDNERKVNFHAMSVKEDQINWCNIPRNYVCVREDFDDDGLLCDYHRLNTQRTECEPESEMPIPVPITPLAHPNRVSKHKKADADYKT